MLGAVLAGGASRRFGQDKAAFVLGGRTLLDRALDALRPQVEALCVVGREWPGVAAVPDPPGPRLGPAGGLLAALDHAGSRGFDAVLFAPCDTPLPPDLRARLGAPPAFALGQPVIGMIGVASSPALRSLVSGGELRMRNLLPALAARPVRMHGLRNMNFSRDAGSELI